MLTNDIFFLYPPGYSGNYLQWAINVSETDTAYSTIKDPLLPDGTTHGFIRRPTHLGPLPTITWILRNRPSKPQTYPVNCFERAAESDNWTARAAWMANMAVRFSPGALFVNIHATDPDDVKYGALNCYSKWPVFFISDAVNRPPLYWNFDLMGGAKSAVIDDRNWLYQNWKSMFPMNPSFNWEEFDNNINKATRWFDSRNALHNWEVNEEQFTVYRTPPRDYILDISLRDLNASDFIDRIFSQWIDSKNVGEFNWDHVKSYHSKYLAAQTNLQWYSCIKKMREEKIVTRFLLSNSLVQALVLDELGEELKTIDDWKKLDLTDILIKIGYDLE